MGGKKKERRVWVLILVYISKFFMLKMLTWIGFLTTEKIDGNINWAYIMQKSKVRVFLLFSKVHAIIHKRIKVRIILIYLLKIYVGIVMQNFSFIDNVLRFLNRVKQALKLIKGEHVTFAVMVQVI